eukprot:scaffold40369_cov51-Phaeocystis_antarctica.AAC.6
MVERNTELTVRRRHECHPPHPPRLAFACCHRRPTPSPATPPCQRPRCVAHSRLRTLAAAAATATVPPLPWWWWHY